MQTDPVTTRAQNKLSEGGAIPAHSDRNNSGSGAKPACSELGEKSIGSGATPACPNKKFGSGREEDKPNFSLKDLDWDGRLGDIEIPINDHWQRPVGNTGDELNKETVDDKWNKKPHLLISTDPHIIS
ncbi:hypothetical protein BDP27DRAFT_1367031 [Rhodocollybia butyracea]|uniref:Uncharacterized protein n=1 Tax=Rhodocollybia butyracea TaxID=206335 RepID=A0A9P5U3M8_9AGAR|nr:hypothetical protein BDP27DRAFT_1367031 [Rhodocollybia butyracea]